MHRARLLFSVLLGCLALGWIGSVSSLSFAQETAADPPPVQPRPLAPGVMTVIPAQVEPSETFTGPLQLSDIVNTPGLDFKPTYTPSSQTLREMAKQVILRREIWGLEFAFKPLRMVQVDIPQPTGVMQKKLIWYMVYRVTNRGGHLRPVPKVDEFGHTVYSAEPVSRSVRFFPHFVLEGMVQKPGLKFDASLPRSENYQRKGYLDRVIPAALRDIYLRELPGRGIRLYNSVEMSRINILPSEKEEHSVWGVATWESIDPRIDYLSVYVQGLTNAFEFEPKADGLVYRHKTLQLNFYRPGDSVLEHEKEIRFGVPIVSNKTVQQDIYTIYGVPDRLDHRWIFR